MAWWSANAHHDDVLSCPLNDGEYDNRSDVVAVLVDRCNMFLQYT